VFEIKVLEQEMNRQTKKEHLNIAVYNHQFEPENFSGLDLIVSAKQKDESLVKTLIEEEIRLAYP
jgi:hypothetical protein